MDGQQGGQRRPMCTIGVLGGGQLGRMMGAAAHRLGLNLIPLDPAGKDSPAGQVTPTCHKGSFKDARDIKTLSSEVDVMTVEIEHVNADALSELPLNKVYPSASCLKLIQDKFLQKQYCADVLNLPVSDFCNITSEADALNAGEKFGYPYMLKARTCAYDGKGNMVVKSASEIPSAFKALNTTLLYAEKWVPFTKELAIMIAVGANNQVVAYPVVETVQRNSICHTVLAPALIPASAAAAVKSVATKFVSGLDVGRGIFGIELFLTKDGEVLLNEIAPRPHNSGHYTIEACETDQFEQHLRAVTGLPLGSGKLKVGAAMMINILGDESASEEVTYKAWNNALSLPGVGMHYYGKAGVLKPGRKVAHVTVTAPSVAQLQEKVRLIDPSITSLSEAGHSLPRVGIIMGSDSDLPCMAAAAKVLEEFNVPFEVTIVSAHRTPDRMVQYAKEAAAERGLQVIIAGAGGAAHLPGMVAALTSLPVIGVPIKTSTLNGQDSLLSIVQMPRGVPVATVAIGNATNAGLLAVRILGENGLMEEYMARQESQVNEKIDSMEKKGWEAYLRDYKK